MWLVATVLDSAAPDFLWPGQPQAPCPGLRDADTPQDCGFSEESCGNAMTDPEASGGPIQPSKP